MQFVNFFLSFQVKMIISINQVYQNLTSTHIHPLVPDISLQFFYQHFGFMPMCAHFLSIDIIIYKKMNTFCNEMRGEIQI